MLQQQRLQNYFESSANTTNLFGSLISCVIDWKWTVLSKFKLISSYFITGAIPGIHFVFVVMLVSLFCVARKMRHAKDCSNASRYDAFVSHNVIKEIDADLCIECCP